MKKILIALAGIALLASAATTKKQTI